MNNFQRLDKIISNSGIGSRSDVKKLVKLGLVSVDGQIVKDSSIKVCPYNQKIEVDGRIINYKKFIYLMMNKPQGVISATYDPSQKTCIDLLSDELKNRDLFPVGRLDIDTEGMLLLTNDGQLAHNILSPKKHVWKKYFAKVTGIISNNDISAFNEGIILNDGYKTMPAKLRVIENFENYTSDASDSSHSNNSEFSQVEVMIKEGKFHQIKRMFEALGKKVVYLKRIQMAGLILDNKLHLGDYRELTELEEVELLKIGGERNE